MYTINLIMATCQEKPDDSAVKEWQVRNNGNGRMPKIKQVVAQMTLRRKCHSERSEESRIYNVRQPLHYVQGDKIGFEQQPVKK
jgi:hypothetical protein